MDDTLSPHFLRDFISCMVALALQTRDLDSRWYEEVGSDNSSARNACAGCHKTNSFERTEPRFSPLSRAFSSDAERLVSPFLGLVDGI